MLKVAHIINPVIIDEKSDLHTAQPVTFESMRLARNYAAGQVEVELFSAQYAEDLELIPEWISKTNNLEKSVLDFGNFPKKRKLPLIKNILDRLYEHSQADYFIYTNVDIALMPYFYTTVAQLIESGIDAMVINRRTISKKPSDPKKIELMWSQAGKKHPGHDCFVFPREWQPNFSLARVCLGVAWVGRVLLWNLCVHSKNFQEFKDLHLTFHLGNDKVWKDQRFTDYEEHNCIQAGVVLDQLTINFGPFTEESSIWPYLSPVPLKAGGPMVDTAKTQGSLFNRLFGNR